MVLYNNYGILYIYVYHYYCYYNNSNNYYYLILLLLVVLYGIYIYNDGIHNSHEKQLTKKNSKQNG